MIRILVFISCLASAQVFAQTNYDLILAGGRIIDGTGNPWFYGDIGVKDGKIVAIGKLDPSTAARVIDITGRVVAPGFIDVHTHIEGNDLRVPTADNFIFDGVTSVVTGNCGSSKIDIADYYRKLDSVKTSINITTLIGHNSVRSHVMGDSDRKPSADEQKQMEDIVAAAMRAGAVGFSTGLIYIPGTYSDTPEVIGLARAASAYGGVYASHIRDEADNVLAAIDEAINIGREANMPVEISHFKVTYKPNWGRSTQTLDRVVNARLSGVDVTVDQYPYIASSTTLNTVVPSWVFSGGRDSVLLRISDPDMRKQIKDEMVSTLRHKQLKSYSYALVARFNADSTLNGKNIAEINQLKGRKARPLEEAETILEMVEQGSAQMVFFSMNEEDLRRIMAFPFNMVASDAGIARFGSGVPHPRAYGTNARVLGTYVRDARILSLEEAIRRMTTLPAHRFNLRDRGMIAEGMAADLVIFDEKTIGDAATFEKPHAYSRGFDYVVVNGQVVVDHGKHTGVRSGVVLHGPGYGKR